MTDHTSTNTATPTGDTAKPESVRARRRLQPFGALVALATAFLMPVLAPGMFVFVLLAIWGGTPAFLLMPVLFLAGLAGVVAGMFVRSTKQAAVLSALGGVTLVALNFAVTGISFG